MSKSTCRAVLLLMICSSAMYGQGAVHAASAAAQPLIVDVHPSAYKRGIVYTTKIGAQRFDMRHATVFEMVQFAYDLGEQDDDRENAAIVGGPPWVDFDRFDVSAKVDPVTAAASAGAGGVALPGDPEDRFRPLMKRVLAERFNLKYHTEQRPLPGYVVTVGKDGPRLAEAKVPGDDGSCVLSQDKVNPPQYTLTCASETMGDFIAERDQDFAQPIIDRTGLTKRYDFALKLLLPPEVHTRDDRARVFSAAFDKQLGLTVSRGDVPQPALVIDSVDHTPTPNPTGVEKLIPQTQDLDFAVASIRLATAEEAESQVRPVGSQITFSSMQLSELIARAWQMPTAAMLGDALPLLPKARFTILAKLPPGTEAKTVAQDPDLLANMLQKLLIERFELKYHMGTWTDPDAYVLMAGTPKMKAADPASRSFCKYGPAEGDKPARYLNSPYDAEFHCQNVTMAQFADLVQTVAGSEVKNRVPDKTGLAGAYTFDLYFTGGRALRTRMAAAAQEAKQAGDASPAPVEGVSVEDAFRKQLGLRLEKQPLTLPALVLDHYDQVPTEN